MKRFVRGGVGLIALTGALSLAVTGPARAGVPVRVTQGEAEATFQAQPTGGLAVEQHNGQRNGRALPAPLADDQTPVVLSPFSSPSDPFCVLDWHVVRVIIGTDTSRGDLYNVHVQIWLDGSPVPLTTTASKPFPGFPGVYWRAFGLVVSPSYVSAGTHTLSTHIDFFDGTSEDDSTTVNVGAPDSSSCQ